MNNIFVFGTFILQLLGYLQTEAERTDTGQNLVTKLNFVFVSFLIELPKVCRPIFVDFLGLELSLFGFMRKNKVLASAIYQTISPGIVYLQVHYDRTLHI